MFLYETDALGSFTFIRTSYTSMIMINCTVYTYKLDQTNQKSGSHMIKFYLNVIWLENNNRWAVHEEYSIKRTMLLSPVVIKIIGIPNTNFQDTLEMKTPLFRCPMILEQFSNRKWAPKTIMMSHLPWSKRVSSGV